MSRRFSWFNTKAKLTGNCPPWKLTNLIEKRNYVVASNPIGSSIDGDLICAGAARINNIKAYIWLVGKSRDNKISKSYRGGFSNLFVAHLLLHSGGEFVSGAISAVHLRQLKRSDNR